MEEDQLNYYPVTSEIPGLTTPGIAIGTDVPDVLFQLKEGCFAGLGLHSTGSEIGGFYCNRIIVATILNSYFPINLSVFPYIVHSAFNEHMCSILIIFPGFHVFFFSIRCLILFLIEV